MAKILIISEDLWYPPNYGDALRQYHLLRNLSPVHDITWCCRIREKRTLQENDEGARFARNESIYISKPSINLKVIKAASSLFSGRPLKQAAFNFRKLKEHIRQLTESESYDIVQIEHTKNAEYVKAIAPSCRAVKLLTVQNLAHLYYERLRWTKKSIFYRFYCDFESKRYWHLEKEVLRWFDGFITVSEENVDWLKKMCVNRTIHLSRNGIDVENVPFYEPSKKPIIMFVGGMDYEPNIDAVLWFKNETLPILWKKRSDIMFHIVGRNPVSIIKGLESDYRIKVFENVPDMKPYYEDAALTVVPLRVGAGTRLKIVESMAYGRVVLSTEIGAEGLLYKDGKNILITNNSKIMAEYVIKVIENINFRNDIASNARKHVENNYNCNLIAKELGSFYEELLSRRATGENH